MAGDFIQRSRHGTVFYFRRRVPLELRQRLGRQHFYVSLRTEELAEAKCRARALAVATDRLFTELRYLPGKKDDLVQLDYSLTLDHDALGRPQFKVTDVKPGDEASVEDLAMRLRGVATLSGKPAVVATTPTVAEASAAVLADPNIKPGTVKEYRRAFAFFESFFGAEMRLSDITQERFAEFADVVAKRPEWEAKTQGSYITAAQRLFTFYASRNSGVPKITTAGLKPKGTGPAGRSRRAFTLDELAVLFGNATVYRDRRPARWWVTVAPAFLGCRIEELAQAHLDTDFLVDPTSGVHYLKIDELPGSDGSTTSSPKSVKTHAGWRRVPIHPCLIDAGFLVYLDDERKQGARTPFGRIWAPHHDKTTGQVKHSHAITKWGGRELAKLIVQGTLPADDCITYFHSMRHSFVTLLGKAGIGEEWNAALAGHEYGGVNAKVYNKAKEDVSVTFPKLERGLTPLAQVFRNASAKG